ncbi:hypothetical protein QTP70_003319 [Hemibagrus guttatus]|uniref:Reverse transcriptase RNase H-like domain-containing protein n=1 Tax=Hemibagrus guttatus TaxID=175788 RepID=A0AAE0PVL1_9TELE|nr:hypothetical protein QTP70_003319 [Hemibagrus guttatus]KAK3526840.1 hypothetical protein QTP86_000705 [Hemibagrus guttatus]
MSSKPLNELLQSELDWCWGHRKDKCSQKCADASADTSSYGLGEVLMQNHNGRLKPVEFCLRMLTNAKKRYAQIDKECLDGVWASKHFYQYLCGLGKCQLLTDHKPLVTFINLKDLDTTPIRCQSLLIWLMKFNPAAEYVPEKHLVVVDALSRISRRGQGLEGVRFGDHGISSLIFADDVVLLAPSSLELQHALGRFAAECEVAGMRVSTSKSEAMVLDRKKVACTLQVGGEVLPQVKEFKYLGVLFTSEGRMDREIDRRIGAAAAVMQSMYRSVVVKKELSWKAKLLIYQSIYVPALTDGHELWVMTERVRSRIQAGSASEISFLRRVAGRSLRDRVRSSVTREELGVEPLLLHIERGQLRWLGHLFRMPPGRLPGEVFRACPTGKRLRGRPRTRWRDYVSRLALERLGVPPEELEEVSGEREVWASLLRLLPPRPGSG